MARIMIVDDDEDFASSAASVLESDGHEVSIELEADKSLAAMEQQHPDLVILDVMFPEDGLAGFEVARSMHRNEKLKDTPILMLTAINVKFPLGFSSTDIDEQWLPVAEFLEKPVDLDALRAKVSSLLGTR